MHLVQTAALRVLYLRQFGIQVIGYGFKVLAFTEPGVLSISKNSHILSRSEILFLGWELTWRVWFAVTQLYHQPPTNKNKQTKHLRPLAFLISVCILANNEGQQGSILLVGGDLHLIILSCKASILEGTFKSQTVWYNLEVVGIPRKPWGWGVGMVS